MGELEFRRRIYEDPDTRDENLLSQAKSSEANQKFWQETRALNDKIKSAVDIPVPDDLADKLILRGAFQEDKQQKRRSSVHLALAASVVFVIGITFTLWSSTRVDLGDAALAHMKYTEDYEYSMTGNVSIDQVNDKLASIGAGLIGDIGRIYSASFCRLDFAESLHLVVEGEEGPVSVFFSAYDNKANVPERFSDENYSGTGFNLQQASVMIVGDKGANLSSIAQRVKSGIGQ